MADPKSPYYNAGKVAEMQAKLDKRMTETATTPA